jgi:hypothetical protein
LIFIWVDEPELLNDREKNKKDVSLYDMMHYVTLLVSLITKESKTPKS